MKQLIVVTFPAGQKKACYNIARKVGLKITIHTRGPNASLLMILPQSALDCNLLSLPEELHGVYRFFDELRKRSFEYRLDVYTHDFQESRKRNRRGVFDTKQTTLC